MSRRPKVGEILLQAGVIDEMQLRTALGEQKRWGSRLGSTLVKLGFLEERDLVRALASQLNLPVATLEGKRIHSEVLALVPLAVAEKHMVIPLFVKREAGVAILYLGTEDPGNLEVFDDLAFRTGLEVRPVMVAPSEICEGIDRYYQRPLREAALAAAAAPAKLEAPQELDLDAESTAPVLPAPRGARRPEPEGTRALIEHWGAPARDDDTPTDPAPASAPAPVVAAPAVEKPPTLEPAPATPPPQPLQAKPASANEPAANAYETKTRVLLQALAQVLVDKGVMTREEFHQRVRDLQLAMAGEPGQPIA